MEKQRRHQAILELLEQANISSQEQLRRRLSRMGFDVTQATLSRDLKELNVVKAASDGAAYKYTVLDNWRGLPVRSCQVSANLLILHTEPGMAPAVAYRIDDFRIEGILGTVAGEDTLLAVVAEGFDARRIRKELWKKVQAL
ncbi:MAG: arginine repressor [Acidobacteria bacterium]|nr:arginine repressor [Acidobacteriota bacterium]